MALPSVKVSTLGASLLNLTKEVIVGLFNRPKKEKNASFRPDTIAKNKS